MPRCQQRCAVDIVLTSCNDEKYIRAQVLSIQKCFRYSELVRKLIVVDDASDDSTLEILYELARADARIVVVPNSGARRGVKKNVAFGLVSESGWANLRCLWYAKASIS